MSDFVYYLPNEGRNVRPERVKALGLAGVLPRWTPRECQRGPDGGQGVVLGASPHAATIGYWPDAQVWRRMPGDDSAVPWVGMSKEAPPEPADLLRERALAGHEVKLPDGNRWTIPLARAYVNEGGQMRWALTLPRSTDIDDRGEWVRGDVVPQYAALWRWASEWATEFFAAVGNAAGEDGQQVQKTSFEFEGLNDAALCALTTNYRVGRVEVAMLHLLDGDAAMNILNALIDYPTLSEWIKKKVQADRSMSGTSNTDAGAPGSTADTGQPLQTCGL